VRQKLYFLAGPLLLLTGACATDSPAPVPSSTQGSAPITAEQAVKVLDEVVSKASSLNAKDFCNEYAYQIAACAGAWKEADDFCLRPGGKPRVLRSAAVRGTKVSAGGRVLEIEGRTAGGQRYVSEFFVTAADGKPRASVGVYWTGLGLAESPLGDDNTVLPKTECVSQS
jgi:hypothetical protein